ncbi:MAG: hypothetical protein DRI61_07370 [Chloroflexi bacterium]|nr:MAG: hypothetical protein DRI61_07370 [Chloroflexota bacterium]
MESLTKMELPSEEQYLFCIRCGRCLPECPTYRVTLKETHSPRARVMLVRKFVEGELEPSPNFIDQIYRCLDCLACNEVCPVGIKPADLALQMRAYFHRTQPQPWFKPLLFRGYFPHPGRIELSMLPVAIYQRLGLQKLLHSLKLNRLFPAQLRDLERLLPNPIPLRPLRHRLPETIPAQGERRYRVGFFLGCFQNTVFAEVSWASIQVLTRNGCEVVMPKDVRCCGMPHIGYGDIPTFVELARYNISLFEGLVVDAIVTDCATCGSTLKEYGKYLGDDPKWAERAQKFSGKVRDVSEFLVEIGFEEPARQLRARVTYHDPCHLRRGQGVWKEPRQVIEAAVTDFIEMEAPDTCCGAAGTQLITHYETSVAILDGKMERVAATGAEILAAGCPGCQLQLGLGIQHRNLKMRVVHPVQLLAEAYGFAGAKGL